MSFYKPIIINELNHLEDHCEELKLVLCPWCESPYIIEYDPYIDEEPKDE